jgi:hypothetical protein
MISNVQRENETLAAELDNLTRRNEPDIWQIRGELAGQERAAAAMRKDLLNLQGNVAELRAAAGSAKRAESGLGTTEAGRAVPLDGEVGGRVRSARRGRRVSAAGIGGNVQNGNIVRVTSAFGE